VNVMPYLFFDGRAEEAAAFYQQALGAEVVEMIRFKDSPAPDDPARVPVPPEAGDKVMHMTLRIGAATVMGSDGDCGGAPAFEGFSLTLTVSDLIEADILFDALADGGQVRMPLTETFFSPRFGMVADRFGVGWMIHVDPEAL
jgi:PhnB protein